MFSMKMSEFLAVRDLTRATYTSGLVYYSGLKPSFYAGAFMHTSYTQM